MGQGEVTDGTSQPGCRIVTTALRLVADDLTGALDTAAEFVGMTGPVHAFWHGAIPSILPPNAALDSGTRELDAVSAATIVTTLAPALAEADIPFKKIDSLMRGPTLAEIAACLRFGKWERAVLAPAFPYQGRATRGGVQHARDPQGHWSAVGGDIVASLRTQGVPAQTGRFGMPLPPGISVFDAETDADLDNAAAVGRAASGSVLWIGTGGLAQALARCSPAQATTPLPLPLLGLFGSDQAVTAGQLAACGADWVRLRDGGPAEAASIAARLRSNGRALVSLDLPQGLARAEAARRIGTELHRLVQALPPPGTLLVAGGETLRGLCLSLGARSLAVQGRIVPGLPRSILRGGAWDCVTVVSKSGAFGYPTLLRDLLDGSPLITERTV
ncbi:MAG: four-carbon acid sugar kinase family protein [Rhodopila sp.]